MIEIYIGTIGAALLLLAFILLEFKKITRTTTTFHLLNLIGSVLLLIYAYLIRSYIFLGLNLIWALVSLYEMRKIK